MIIVIQLTVREISSFKPFNNEKSGKNAIFGATSHTHARATLNYMTPVTPKEQKRQYEPIIKLVPYFIAALLWIILATREQYFLHKIEDLSLFMFDWNFIKDSLSVPGGLLGVAGSFLTQFLYIPWAGALIWVILLLMIYQLTIRALNIPQSFRSLAIIPAALSVIACTSLGYAIFIARAHDYFFATLLGYIAALIPVFAIKRIGSATGKLILLLIWSVAGYTILGAYAFAGTIAAAIIKQNETDIPRAWRIGILSGSIILTLLVPVIMYGFYTSFRMSDGWTLGLPAVSESEWTSSVRVPFILTLLSLPLLSIVSLRLKEGFKSIVLPTAIYIISAASVYGFWFKDSNFHTELAMSDAVDRFDWQQVIDIYQKAVTSKAKSDSKAYKARTAELNGIKDQNTRSSIVEKYSRRFFEPTRTMVLYRDLALIKTGRALDEAFTMKDGGRPQKSLTQIAMTYQSGEQFYFQYGLPNLCYRWCLENAVEHGWSTGSVKYMALLSILTDEQDMAYKFLDMLDNTLFHRKWAAQFRTLVTDRAKVQATAPFNSILPLLCFDDKMSNDLGKCEMHLIRHFIYDRPDISTPEFDVIALFWAMRTQSIPDFWKQLSYYMDTNDAAKLPRGVQEAALLYTSLEKHSTDIQYDLAVMESYNRFTQYVSKHQVRDTNESAYAYSQQFGRTFYYYYYFIRNINTY